MNADEVSADQAGAATEHPGFCAICGSMLVAGRCCPCSAYQCPKCFKSHSLPGICRACMPSDPMPPKPAAPQPSASKTPEEYADYVGNMAKGLHKQSAAAERRPAEYDLWQPSIVNPLQKESDQVIIDRAKKAVDDQFARPTTWPEIIKGTLRDYLDPETQRQILKAQQASDDAMEKMREIAEKARFNDTPATPEQRKASCELLFGTHDGFGSVKSESARKGRCPNCSHWYGWVGSEEEARLILVGEKALCVYCRKRIVAAPRTVEKCSVCACILTDQSRYAGHPDICTTCFEQKQKLEAIHHVKTPKYCPRCCGHIPATELHACFPEDESDRLAKLEQDLQEERGRHQHTRFALAAKEQALEESLTYINNQGWKAEMDKANVAYRALEARLDERLQKHDETLNKWNVTMDILAKVQDERDNLKTELERAITQLEKSAEDRESWKNRAARAERDKEQYRKQAERAAHWQTDCAAAKTELEEHKRSCQILHENLIKAETRLNEARGVAKKDDDDRLKTINELWDAAHKLQVQLDEQKALVEAFKGKAATLESDRDAFEKELRCVQETAKKDDEARVAIIKDREMTMAVKDDRIHELETELTFVARDAAANEDYAKSASAKLAEMEDKLQAGIRQEHNILEKAMQEARREIIGLTEANEGLRIRDCRLNDAEQEIERVRETNTNLRATRDGLCKRVEDLQNLLDSATEDRDTYKNDSIRYSNAVAEAREEAKSAKKTSHFWHFLAWIAAITSVLQFLASRLK